ncbi:MAG TPA: molecular chaperone HscC [Burkholderiales bacterium]|nr:molecular chaperone HscC [Burkholderiales bacterium]
MIVGIDLGTTNSLVAAWKDGAPRLIPNGLGEFLTPSCVSIDEDGDILVGRAARERLQTHPDRTAAVFKRFMGTNKTFDLHRKVFRPEELSSLVLRSLKADAEAFLGTPVTEAVITVPAYFSDAQRKATRAAGQLAGLRVDRLLNEPTAAALAHGMHQRDAASRFLVFDLGGGTFDVSILELFEGVMEVRASAGDNFLGGEDFVQCLVELFFERNKLPGKLKGDPAFMQQVIARAEAAKRALSLAPNASIRVAHKKDEYTLDIDEALLEQTCAHLLKRLREPVERALRDANLRSSALDRIVLAGGATRMPIVKRLVTRMFGRFPASDINPDEVVALGAAVQAGLKMKDAALKEVVMTDVAPYSLGLEVAVSASDGAVSNGHFDPVIERNSPIPISRVKRYYPVQDRQPHIQLQIYQGEARMVVDNIHLGRLMVDLPSMPREQCGVDVRFTYDVNGLLQVEATVLRTQQTSAVVILDNPGVLSDEEIATRLKTLSDLKIHPRDRLEHRTLLARAERLYLQMRAEQREQLGRQILEYERILEKQDLRAIEPLRQQFERIVNDIEHDSYLAGGADDPHA